MKNYYLLLGVSRNETAAGIQEAFRELAKKFHPDVAGPESAEQFRDLLEAYKHLSDPQARARHNQTLSIAEEQVPWKTEPLIPRQSSRAEPLVPNPVFILRDFETYRPSFDEMFDRIVRNFTGIGLPKGERSRDLTMELILTPAEATRGGVVPIAVPFFRRCPLCAGTGRDWLFPCRYCRERGLIEEEDTIGVEIPPGVHDGTILDLPIGSAGLRNLQLRLHIRIAP